MRKSIYRGLKFGLPALILLAVGFEVGIHCSFIWANCPTEKKVVADGEQQKPYWYQAGDPNNLPVWLTMLITGFVGAVALATLGDIKRQTTLANLNAKVAEQTIVATFHPKLTVRSVAVSPKQQDDYNGIWEVNFTVANTGGSKATITRLVAGCCVIKGQRLPAIPPRGGFIDQLPEMPLESGDHQEFKIALSEEVSKTLGYSIPLVDFPENSWLYFLGKIRFNDGNGTTRSIGFCRLYHPGTERFTAVEDADYEYADEPSSHLGLLWLWRPQRSGNALSVWQKNGCF